MKIRTLLVLVLLLQAMAGCYGVYSTEPVGEKALVIDPEDWEGTWVHADMAVTLAVIDGKNGWLQAGWVEKKQGKLVYEQFRVQLRQSGEWVFGNVRDPEKPKWVLWGKVRREGQQAVVWFPDRQRLEALVGEGVLPGHVEKPGEHVILHGYKPEALPPLSVKNVPLEWDRPLIFRRLSR